MSAIKKMDKATEFNHRKTDQSKTNFTMIPNILDELNLSVYAFRLYFHIARIFNLTNRPISEGTRKLAAACNMSHVTVNKAKAELEKAELITIVHGNASKGEADSIFVLNIWDRNSTHFPVNAGSETASETCKPDLQVDQDLLATFTGQPQPVSQIYRPVSQIYRPVNVANTYIRIEDLNNTNNNKEEEEETALATPSPCPFPDQSKDDNVQGSSSPDGERGKAAPSVAPAPPAAPPPPLPPAPPDSESASPTTANNPEAPSRKPRERDLLWDAFIALCLIDLDVYASGGKGGAARFAKELKPWREKKVTAEHVKKFGDWWKNHHWKGQKGTPPDMSDIAKEWGRFAEWHRQHKAGIISQTAAPLRYLSKAAEMRAEQAQRREEAAQRKNEKGEK